MKQILIILLAITGLLASCKKEDDSINIEAMIWIDSVSPSDVPTYPYKYIFHGNVVLDVDTITGKRTQTRNVGVCYSTKVIPVQTYQYTPFLRTDSIVH